jgi:hypothetical protein
MAIGLSDFSFFSLPPNRPSRSERRTDRGGRISSILRTIRHELAHAADAPVNDWMPRLTNYPY